MESRLGLRRKRITILHQRAKGRMGTKTKQKAR